MVTVETAAWPNLYVDKQFLDPGICREILAEMSAAPGAAATVYGRTASRSVDQGFRQTLRIHPSVATVELIVNRLVALQPVVEQHFDVELSECEDPQFLHYREGDFFVAHQDGNTGLLQLDTERRLVSTVIFLSHESDSPQSGAHCGNPPAFGAQALARGRSAAPG